MNNKIIGVTVGTTLNPNRIGEKIGSSLPTVRYDTAQNLTPEQKAQARANIGAASPGEGGGGGGGTSEGAVRYDVEQGLDETNKARARANIGALGTDYVPPVQTVEVKPLTDKKILCLGDSIIGNDRTNGIPSYLAEYSGATVYNGGFGGTFLSIRNSSSANVCFDLPNLLDAKISGNWSAQETQASLSSFKYFPETVEMLKNLDFNELDVITLSYGTNDWSGKEDSEYVLTHLKESIDKIQLNWPLLRILVITPIWRHFGTADTSSDDYTKYGEGFTLREWSQKIEQAAKEKHISVLNAYENMPLSLNNIATYFDKDSSQTNGFHRTNLNEKGNQIYAQIICGKLCSILAPSGTSESTNQDEPLKIDETLKYNEQGALGVNTATETEQDNTLPITSAAVYTAVGNIEVLLGTI